ncbi:MAG: L-threonine 3-dehydrogenase [Planctomycetota bacterium]|nr:L-threonine 3-dehydrogenase [Planctomycetota bacterium]
MTSAVTSADARTRTAGPRPAPGAAAMRALVKSVAGPGLTYDDRRPMPAGSHGKLGELGPREVLIRVNKAGVCGTDRHIWEWDAWAQSRIPVGIVTGHEFAGVIEKIGSAVTRVQPGQRCSAEGHITSYTDFNSRTGNAHIARDTRILGVDRDGCFADYLIVPEENVWPLHDQIPDKLGAVMDPLGNAVHTVMAAGVSARTVLITGAGIIGLMAITVAKAAGASRIYATDPDPRRLALARRLGAAEAFSPITDKDWVDRVRRETRGDGPDVLLEMSGAPSAIDEGFRALRMGGTAALLGIPSKAPNFDLTNHVIFKGATVLGINGRRMWETWYQMENLLLSGRLDLDPIITHELPFASFARAFELMQSGDGIKIVLDLNA